MIPGRPLRSSRAAVSRRAGAALALAVVILGGCTRAERTVSPSPPPHSAGPAAATPAPASSLAPASARPSAPPVAASDAATLAPAAVTAAPAASPAILSAQTSQSVVHAGETVLWTVRTTADVVTVTAAAQFYKFTLKRNGPGRFSLPFTIPAAAPPFFHGSYSLTIVASTIDGRSAETTLPIRFE